MADRPFNWPNNAWPAFVFGIAFEARGREKPTRGAALQSCVPAEAF